MPLYDFQCRACGAQFEALVRSHDGPPACPSCASTDLERLISSFAVSSAERRQAAADKSLKRDRAIAARDNAAIHRESERHRREDH